MALTIEKRKTLPPKILIYGTEGIGKTKFGADSMSPIFLPFEKGLAGLPDVDSFPVSATYEQAIGYLKELATEEHDKKTLVVDSLDWLEPLIWDKICRVCNVDSIEKVDGGYGKGYAMALIWWRQYLEAIDYLNEQKDMTIIHIAHAQAKRYENPETDAYDRYAMKLQDGKNTSAAALMMEYHDIVFFANIPVFTRKEDKVFNKERRVATSSGSRMLYCSERPAFKAKNRYELPEEIPFTKDGSHWAVIAQHVPYFNQLKGE